MMFNIAHNMDNPLNGLSGFAPLVAVGAGDSLASEQAARPEYLTASGARLEGIMRGVMDLLRLELGKLMIGVPPIDARRCEDAAASSP